MTTEDDQREQATRRAQEDFGRWLVDLRTRRGVSQAELARAAGLSAQLISNVEKGHRRATDRYLQKVAQALEHGGGWKHMREKRDFLRSERISKFLAARLKQLEAAGLTEESPEVQALLAEAAPHLKQIEYHWPILNSYLAALGKGVADEWDPDRVRRDLDRRRGDAPVPTRQPSVTSGPETDTANELLDELTREAAQLSTSQLLRVLGYVAALRQR